MIQLGALADYLSRIQSEFDLTVARAKDTNKLYWTYTYHNGVTEVCISPTV